MTAVALIVFIASVFALGLLIPAFLTEVDKWLRGQK